MRGMVLCLNEKSVHSFITYHFSFNSTPFTSHSSFFPFAFGLISMEEREARIKPNAKRKESRELFLLKYTTNNRNHSPNLGLISSPYQRSFIIG